LFTSALIEASSLGWGSPRIVGALLGAGVLIAFFVIAERLQHRPMFDLGLFRNPSFVAAQILSIAFSSIFVTLEVYLPLYFQGVRGYSALQAGLVMASLTVPLFIMPILVSKLATRLPLRSILSAGLVLMGVGLLWMGRSEAYVSGLVVTGIGAGTIIGLLDNLAVSVVPSQRSGMAAGIFNTMRFGGDATGIAGAGAILFSLIQLRLLDLLRGTPAAAAGGRAAELVNSVTRGDIDGAAASVPAVGREVFFKAATQAYIGAMHTVFIILACISFASAVLALALVRARDIVEEPTS
jgi:MFS family permease